MSPNVTNIKKIKPARELDRNEKKFIKNLGLSRIQDEEVGYVWAREENSLKGIGQKTIFMYLLERIAIAGLLANVWFKNPTTVFADNLIVTAVIIVSLLSLAVAIMFHKIPESEDRNIILSHTGIQLLHESGFVTKTFSKITIVVFTLLFIGSGHQIWGIILLFVLILWGATVRQAKSKVKETLDSIS